MSRRHIRDRISRDELDRRAWLRRPVAGAASLAGSARAAHAGDAAQEPKLTSAEEAANELERAVARVRAATSRPLQTITSDQYQAVGDATESFMKITAGRLRSDRRRITWIITRPRGLGSNDPIGA